MNPSEAKAARPELLFLTKVGQDAAGHALAIVGRTVRDAFHAGLNSIPARVLMVVHGGCTSNCFVDPPPTTVPVL